MSKKEIKKAIALRYDPNINNAPHVIAKGKGEIAKRIVDQGNKNDVKIHEDKALVQLLYQLDVNEQIPSKLFPIIAEVFSLVYQAEKIAERKKNDNK